MFSQMGYPILCMFVFLFFHALIVADFYVQREYDRLPYRYMPPGRIYAIIAYSKHQYTVPQLNWYLFCFANEFVNFENNSMKFYKSLER